MVLALLAWFSVALYQKKFSSVATVTLYTSSVGNEMHPGAQVLARGVQVGEVRQVTADGDRARLELAIQPGELPMLPANVTAEMLPTTLFGQRYVALIVPASPSRAALGNGSVISENRSADGLELERVLNNLLPMLSAVQPQKLSLTLTAIADGLRGRGRELGQTLVTLNSYLHQFNRQLPALDADITLLSGLARKYTAAAPAILQALNDFGVTGKTIAAQRSNFAALLANVTTASDDLHAFLDANSANMISLSVDSLPTLQILQRYAPEFPCTLRDLANFVPKVNKVLGAGTGEPGLHVQVVVVPSPGRYLPGRDTPRYGDNTGPHCYPVPFPGIHLNDGTGPAPRRSGPPPARATASQPPGGERLPTAPAVPDAPPLLSQALPWRTSGPAAWPAHRPRPNSSPNSTACGSAGRPPRCPPGAVCSPRRCSAAARSCCGEAAMKRGSLAGPLIKSIIFVVVTVLITAVLGISIAHTGVSATTGYQAVFSDVTGLTVGDDVDIAGVRVGEVTSISVYDRNRALVGFAMQPGRPLPASVTATITYLNLVGQRYIELARAPARPGGTLRRAGPSRWRGPPPRWT